MELGAHELENLGEGPITVDLISGRLPDGVADGSVNESNGVVRGYRTWTGNKHFVVAGPAELRASIEFVTRGITPYEVPNP